MRKIRKIVRICLKRFNLVLKACRALIDIASALMVPAEKFEIEKAEPSFVELFGGLD